MRTARKSWCVGAALTCGVLAQAGAMPAGWQPLDAATLDRQRGGFTSTSGRLEVSLGIERQVSVNGAMVAQSRLEVANIGALSPAQAQETGAALSAVKLIQNGGATISMAGLSGDFLGGTIVQNTLNNQHIESRTLINASVNSADLLSALQFHGALSDALTRATGP